MPIDVQAIEGAFELADGFPRPNWRNIAKWIKTKRKGSAPPELEETWSEVARQWLLRLKLHLGSSYEVYESENFLLLSSRESRRSQGLLEFAERALKSMLTRLPGVFQKRGYGKFVCLWFGKRATYYDYICYFFKEGRYGGSAGVFVQQYYRHFVLNHVDPRWLESVFAHELTHACLTKLNIPLWLEEGITQLAAEGIAGLAHFKMNREEFERHQDYWRSKGLGPFWHGTSFLAADEGQQLSYMLSQILIRNMLSKGRELFLKFVNAARRADCGESASRQVYGISLATWAGQFLGEGDWDPPPGLQPRGEAPPASLNEKLISSFATSGLPSTST